MSTKKKNHAGRKPVEDKKIAVTIYVPASKVAFIGAETLRHLLIHHVDDIEMQKRAVNV